MKVTYNDIIRASSSMKKLIEKELSSPKIEKCSNCFLINLDYVESIMKDDIIIDGKRIKIARNRKKDFVTKNKFGKCNYPTTSVN